MLALVTGSTGFIGSHICQALVTQGTQVRAFHRPGSPLTLLEGLPVEHAVGDLTDAASLESAMQGVDVVFHAAAQLGSHKNPDQIYNITVQGTRHVLEAAFHAKVKRIVHTSSVAALGVPPQKHLNSPYLLDERYTWNFKPEWWRYGYAKYLAELEVQSAVAKGLDAVIVNPTIVLGAGDINRISGDIVIHVAKRHIPVSIEGGLNAIHINDVARGHLAALERGRCGERNILGNQNMTHHEFLSAIASVASVAPPLIKLPIWVLPFLVYPLSLGHTFFHLPLAGSDLHRAGCNFYYDTRKAQNELGLTDMLPVRQAIEETLAWYKKTGILK
ncbi:MAG: NAD-dependent epimerase/dehydratase family protein [Anaerolineales bacterium]|nr:NAD-dependent epimerase/dehydratase family protein [Anaerolineales bacterium]